MKILYTLIESFLKSLILGGLTFEVKPLMSMKKPILPFEKVVAFYGSEKAKEILRFATCFEKVISFEFWVSLEKKENLCEKFTHFFLKEK
jgi:hypothetical protein